MQIETSALRPSVPIRVIRGQNRPSNAPSGSPRIVFPTTDHQWFSPERRLTLFAALTTDCMARIRGPESTFLYVHVLCGQPRPELIQDRHCRPDNRFGHCCPA
jgi:hypothetical protein